MIVGCYTLDLYCRNYIPGNVPHNFTPVCMAADAYGPKHQAFQFTGHTLAQAKAQARKAGWMFRDGDAECPWCVRAYQAAGNRSEQ
jgi:hypothetical protein